MVEVRLNGFAVASMVLGIFGMFAITALLAVIFGHLALTQIKAGEGLAAWHRDGIGRRDPRVELPRDLR